MMQMEGGDGVSALDKFETLSEYDRQIVNDFIDRLWRADQSEHQQPHEPHPTN